MKHFSILLTLLCGFITLSAQTQNDDITRLVGGDISMLPKYEAAKVGYYNQQGNRINNLIEYLRDEAGYNVARVRLFVNPTGETGVVQDLDYVLALCKQIKDADLQLMLDFHYSDTWADPGKQWTPKAWINISETDLPDTIYQYTKRVLETLVAAGATPDYIQTGNEISYGMLWGAEGKRTYYCHYDKDDNWDRFRNLLSHAGKACREICPDAKIIIHTERSNNGDGTRKIYNRLSTIDYDVIGLSYYPEWHNSIDSLKAVLNSTHNYFPDKEIIIVETGYYNDWYSSNATYDFQSKWPASPAGQKAFLDELVKAVRDLDYMRGILYWFPEENPYNNRVYEPWYNHGLFNPKNGRASDALFSLKALRESSTAIEQLPQDNSRSNTLNANQPINTLDGRLITITDNGNLPHGVYIQNGKKIIR